MDSIIMKENGINLREGNGLMDVDGYLILMSEGRTGEDKVGVARKVVPRIDSEGNAKDSKYSRWMNQTLMKKPVLIVCTNT
jgi:hypothetical protein